MSSWIAAAAAGRPADPGGTVDVCVHVARQKMIAAAAAKADSAPWATLIRDPKTRLRCQIDYDSMPVMGACRSLDERWTANAVERRPSQKPSPLLAREVATLGTPRTETRRASAGRQERGAACAAKAAAPRMGDGPLSNEMGRVEGDRVTSIGRVAWTVGCRRGRGRWLSEQAGGMSTRFDQQRGEGERVSPLLISPESQSREEYASTQRPDQTRQARRPPNFLSLAHTQPPSLRQGRPPASDE